MLDSKTKRQIIIFLSILFFVGISATDIYVPSLPQMAHDFHTSASQVNLTLASFSLSIAINVLFTGEISNRFGCRPILIIGILLFGIAALLMTLVASLWLMIVLRAIQALGGAIILIIPRLILKDSMNEREQIRANGLLLSGIILSPAISPIIGAQLASVFGWRSVFLVTALLSFMLMLWALRHLPETNLSPIRHFRQPQDYAKCYYHLLINPRFLTLTLIYAGAVAAYFSFIGVSSYLYIGRWQMSMVEYSFIFLGFSIAYLIGNQIMLRLNQRNYSASQMIGSGVYLTAIGISIILGAYFILHGHHRLLIIVVSGGAFLMRAGNALINPPTQIKIMSYFKSHSAQALGLNLCIGFGFNSLATSLVTLLPNFPFSSLVAISFVFVSLSVISYHKNHKLLY